MLIKIAILILITQHTSAVSRNNCDDLLRELVCGKCKDAFASVNETYTALRDNTTCAAKYFDKDRVNLVASTEAALNSLWMKAYCDYCNENNTAEFDHGNTEFKDCLTKYKNESCKRCLNQYVTLNNFYNTLDEHNNGKVCFDIQDSMNRSRNTWSKDLKCCRREFRMTLFVVALCIVTCLPFIFYSVTYLVTKRQERNHGTLNDEDPLFSSSAPSSSNAIVNPNIHSEEVPTSSRQRMSCQSEPTKQSKGFITLDDESDDDSDEENLAIKNKLQ